MGKTRYILAGNLIDGTGAGIYRDVFLAIRDGVITAIGPAADLLPRTSGATVDDLSHCTIVPALIDCSVSLSRSPAMDIRPGPSAGRAGLAERHSRYCHTHGVLGIGVSDDLPPDDIRTAASAGLIDIRMSGPLCRSRRECEAVDRSGADFLRIGYSSTIEEGGEAIPGFSREDLAAILQQKGARKTVVLVNGRQRVAEALAAGCDAIEQGYSMGGDNLRMMAEKSVLWLPSILRAKNALDAVGGSGEIGCRFSTRYVSPGKPMPAAETSWKKVLAEQLSQLQLAGKLGVPTAIGTGAGSEGILHGESMVEEIKLFLKGGYTLEDTIRCASENGARFFNMENLGALKVGSRATFLVTRGTAQLLPRKLSYLENIYVDGSLSILYRKNPHKSI